MIVQREAYKVTALTLLSKIVELLREQFLFSLRRGAASLLQPASWLSTPIGITRLGRLDSQLLF